MKERYSRVAHRVWRDPWFRALTKDRRMIWFYLLTSDEVKLTGIQEIDLPLASVMLEISKEEIVDALAQFAADGKITRDGHWLAVNRFWPYQQLGSGRAFTGAQEEASDLLRRTKLGAMWLGEYAPDHPEAMGSLSNGPDADQIAYRMAIDSLSPDSLSNGYGSPIATETVTETDTKQTPVTASPILGERELEIFDQCIAAIAEKTSHKTANSNPKTSQKKFKQVVEIDKVPLGDVLPALKWALEDDFWQDKLFGIVGWRKDGGNGPKFWQMWRKWKAQRAQEQPRVKDPRAVAFFAQHGITEPTDADWAAWREHLAATRSAPVVDAPSVKPWELRKQQEAEIHQQRAEEARRKIADEHQVD